MAIETQEFTKLTDDQVEKELKDLQGKTDSTAEDKEKLSTLKEERQTRYQKRIDKLSFEKKRESEEKEQLKRDLAEQKAELEKLKADQQRNAKPKIADETIEIAGRKFYTDASLESMIQDGEMTPQQGYAHQQQRLKAEIKEETIREIKGEEEKKVGARAMQEDRESVLNQYPHFSPSHPGHDPEDPLYKTASELWVEGLQHNPKGLSIAIKRAKQILRMSDTRPDVSDEHSVGRSRGGSDLPGKSEKEASLSPDEKEAAIRMYGVVVNPVTGRNYTEAESILKATKAKTARMRR